MAASLATRSLAHVRHPCTQMKLHEAQPPIAIARASGPWLHDVDGRRYLDGVSSWWVNLFGHSHPHIKAALADQLGRLDHVMLAGFTHAPVVELSERLAALHRTDSWRPAAASCCSCQTLAVTDTAHSVTCELRTLRFK